MCHSEPLSGPVGRKAGRREPSAGHSARGPHRTADAAVKENTSGPALFYPALFCHAVPCSAVQGEARSGKDQAGNLMREHARQEVEVTRHRLLWCSNAVGKR